MEKIKYLEGLRGVAALMVVLNHFILFYPAIKSGSIIRLTSGTPLVFFYSGNFAVCIFFILSGYVLTHKFFKYRDNKIILSGMVRRYFRLLIPVFFSIILAYSLMNLSLFYNKEAAILTKSSWLASFWNFDHDFINMLKIAFFGVFFFEGNDIYNASTWTMTYEFYGSFLAFGVAFLSVTLKRKFFYVLAIILSTNTYYLAFILGVMLSDLHNGKVNYLKKVDARILTVFFLLIGLVLGSNQNYVNNSIFILLKTDLISDPIIFYRIIGSFFIMLALLNSDVLKSILSNKIIHFLGIISFSMYLLHLIIIGSFSSFLFIKLASYFSYDIAFALTFCLSLIVIIIISYFMYKYIDTNAIRFSNYVYRKIIYEKP